MTSPHGNDAPDLVAIVGNPNTGKSTLFNALTGARVRVGNYPGVTVERSEGRVSWNGRALTLLDLPGTYSLAAASGDEQVVIDALCGRLPGIPRPALAICVADAANLRRSLFLASQVGETGVPIVIALNMADEAERQGIRLDAALLSERLGVPVVRIVATRGHGIRDLQEAVGRALQEKPRFIPVPWPECVVESLGEIERSSRLPLQEGEKLRVLFDVDSPVAVRTGLEPARVRELVSASRSCLSKSGIDPGSVEAVQRYSHLARLLRGIETKGDPVRAAEAHRMDRFLTHRVAGLLVFFALMFGVFSSIYWLAQPAMEAIDGAFGILGEWVGAGLASHPTLRSLIADGLIAGVGGVLQFLPQILILFFFISVLEDTGYMARAAFLMDRVFRWTGLNGKSFVPMLSGYACAIPALLSTRTIEDPKARLTTILVTPLMSCSARLPIYVLLIAAFVEPQYGPLWAGATLCFLHLLGLLVAIPVAFFINRFFRRLKPLPFLLEMPPYRRPKLRNIVWRMYRSGREFVVRAGTVIVLLSLAIWALTYFPRPDDVRRGVVEAVAIEQGVPASEAEKLVDGTLRSRLQAAYLEQSYLGRVGKAIQPVFAPAGFDWKITVAILASFPAREVAVSTLGIVYQLDEEQLAAGESSPVLRERLASPRGGNPVTLPVAVAIMVFFAFCMQCSSTLAVMAREAGWRWAGFAFVYMTSLAWVGAVMTYQVGRWLGAG